MSPSGDVQALVQQKGEPSRPEASPSPLTDLAWRAIEKASFAVISYVTPSGEPRSSGVVYATAARRIYVAVAPDSWKARHIASSGHVSVTVPVRRGGLLALLLPIPPATISFAAEAVVHPPGSFDLHAVSPRLARLIPPGTVESAALIVLTPQGEFLTYGIGLPLMQMRDRMRARGRTPVTG